MEITETQYQQIDHCMPCQRGNVSHSNLQILNAILYVTEHGCKWRGLPKRFGNWHTIYTRMNRWAKSGVLQKVFEQSCSNNKSFASKLKPFRWIALASKCILMARVH